MVQIHVINISWERILFNEDEIKKYSAKNDSGIYQIYGQHPAYGSDALLYIGKAENFAIRLNKRFEFTESSANPTSIRLGRIVNSKNPDDAYNIAVEKKWEAINIAEKILIKAHTPAFNKQENSGLFSEDIHEFNREHYIILNWEDYGSLLPEISTLKLSYRFWDFENPIV